MAVGVALGHPDLYAPADAFKRTRAALDEIVTRVR